VISGSAALALPALASPPKKNARYFGETSQQRTVQLRVSRTGRRVVSPSVAVVDLECPNGQPAFGTVQPIGARIRNGRFSWRGSHTIGSYRYAATINGSFTSRGRDVDGTLTLRRVSTNGTVCRSGEVSYSARARR